MSIYDEGLLVVDELLVNSSWPASNLRATAWVGDSMKAFCPVLLAFEYPRAVGKGMCNSGAAGAAPGSCGGSCGVGWTPSPRSTRGPRERGEDLAIH